MGHPAEKKTYIKAGGKTRKPQSKHRTGPSTPPPAENETPPHPAVHNPRSRAAPQPMCKTNPKKKIYKRPQKNAHPEFLPSTPRANHGDPNTQTGPPRSRNHPQHATYKSTRRGEQTPKPTPPPPPPPTISTCPRDPPQKLLSAAPWNRSRLYEVDIQGAGAGEQGGKTSTPRSYHTPSALHTHPQTASPQHAHQPHTTQIILSQQHVGTERPQSKTPTPNTHTKTQHPLLKSFTPTKPLPPTQNNPKNTNTTANPLASIEQAKHDNPEQTRKATPLADPPVLEAQKKTSRQSM